VRNRLHKVARPWREAGPGRRDAVPGVSGIGKREPRGHDRRLCLASATRDRVLPLCAFAVVAAAGGIAGEVITFRGRVLRGRIDATALVCDSRDSDIDSLRSLHRVRLTVIHNGESYGFDLRTPIGFKKVEERAVTDAQLGRR
jgi:hypothetical protein